MCESSDDEPAPFRLGYVTDVEGNLEYFKKFVRQSNVLRLVAESDLELVLDLYDDSCYFVFGGDSVDKGPGDIRLNRALVSLKRKHPERVHLLVGNRDLNKLRFSAELSEADLKWPLEDIPGPHWDPKAPTLQEFLEKELQTNSSLPKNITVHDINTRVNRLKYMLKHTLGCPNTFEYRRLELSILRQCEAVDVSDEDVVDNFLYEVENPEGSLRQYLENAEVAAALGNTLFVHGAVDERTMKYVPALDTKFENPSSKPKSTKIYEDLNEWVAELNSFLKAGLKDHYERPEWDDTRSTRGGEALLALQNRPAVWGRSIVSNCYGDGGVIFTENASELLNNPTRLSQEKHNPLVFEGVSSDPRDPKVAEWLMQHGIKRVVVGHKPTGDSPAVLTSAYTGVEIVSGDTSFSDTSARDNRGSAVAVVEIIGKSKTTNRLELSGSLSSGETYSGVFPVLESVSQTTADEPVSSSILGRELPGGWWIKAMVSSDFLLCRGRGRHVEYKRSTIEELTPSLKHDLLTNGR